MWSRVTETVPPAKFQVVIFEVNVEFLVILGIVTQLKYNKISFNLIDIKTKLYMVYNNAQKHPL